MHGNISDKGGRGKSRNTGVSYCRYNVAYLAQPGSRARLIDKPWTLASMPASDMYAGVLLRLSIPEVERPTFRITVLASATQSILGLFTEYLLLAFYGKDASCGFTWTSMPNFVFTGVFLFP